MVKLWLLLSLFLGMIGGGVGCVVDSEGEMMPAEGIAMLGGHGNLAHVIWR